MQHGHIVKFVVATVMLLLASLCCHVSALGQDAAGETDVAAQSARLAERDRLWQQSQRHAAAGDHAAAVASAEQVATIEMDVSGAVSPEVAFLVGWIGDEHVAAEDYESAATAFGYLVQILDALPDTKPWDLVDARMAAADARQRSRLDATARQQLAGGDALNEQLILRYQEGDYEAALALGEQVLALRQKLLGDEHPATWSSLCDLGRVHQALGNYSQALQLYERSVAVQRETLGADHPYSTAAINRLARLFEQMGKHRRAAPLFEQVVAITSNALGPEHPDTADALTNLGNLRIALGEYGRARQLLERALAINKKVLGPVHASTASSLNDLAIALQSSGEYGQALSLFEQALDVDKELFGDDHPATAASLSNLGNLYVSLGEYQRALPLLAQALAITEQAHGADHQDTAPKRNNLARLFQETGDYARAAPLYEQVVAITRRSLGDKHPDVASAMINLGNLHFLLGEFARARTLFEQALVINQEALGRDHPATATTLNNLARLYQSSGEYDRALPLFEQALAVNKQVLGNDHPGAAVSTANLAQVLLEAGDYARALTLFEQAYAVRLKTLGSEHPATASSLGQIAVSYALTGDYDRALPLYQQVLAIRRKSLGDRHPTTARSQQNLAAAYAGVGDAKTAAANFVAAAAAEQRSLDNQLLFFSEARVRAVLSRSFPSIDLLASLPLADLKIEDQALEVLLNSKAVAFEVLNLRRTVEYLAEVDTEVAALRRELIALQRRMELLALQPPADTAPDDLASQRAVLRDEMERLDEQLSRSLADFIGTDASSAVSLEDVRSAMRADSAHIEYFCYAPYDFTVTGYASRWNAPRYAAFVLSPGQHGSVQFFDLGPADEMDALIDRLAEHRDEYKRLAGSLADELDFEDEYRDLAGALSQKLFGPLRDAVGASRKITLGPDGRLHELAFEALLDDSGQYLIEAGYQFAYVNSGRDLLRRRGEAGVGVAVIAGPDYALGYEQRLALADQTAAEGEIALARNESAASGAAAIGPALSRSADTRRGWRDLGDAALREGREAAAAFADSDLGPVATYSRGQASEEVVKRLVSPRVLVLITHGDFLPNEPRLEPETNVTRAFAEPAVDRGGAGLARSGLRAVEDPFLRSYLVLAGANEIDEEIPAGVEIENGWLTAREIAQLDLRGTDLVVLSACSSNRGDANNGQAVMGMRSAFLFAGARTIVGSLCEVPNEETRQLLKPFYQGVAAGDGKLAALNAAKLAFIESRRETEGAAHPFYWGSFILVGEP